MITLLPKKHRLYCFFCLSLALQIHFNIIDNKETIQKISLKDYG